MGARIMRNQASSFEARRNRANSTRRKSRAAMSAAVRNGATQAATFRGAFEILEARTMLSGAGIAISGDPLPMPTTGTGNGLSATFYGNMTLSGAPAVTEVDPTVD